MVIDILLPQTSVYFLVNFRAGLCGGLMDEFLVYFSIEEAISGVPDD